MIRSWPWAAIIGSLALVSTAALSVAAVSAKRTPISQQYQSETVSVASEWSPNHVTLATIETDRWFATPEGGNSCLYFNMQPMYPKDCTPRPKDTWRHVHAFYTLPEWSPDGRDVALVEKIFDWEYYDPYGRYFDGEATSIRYYLVVVGTDRSVLGYPLPNAGPSYSRYSHTYAEIPPPQLHWQGNSQIVVNGQTYDLAMHPPVVIP